MLSNLKEQIKESLMKIPESDRGSVLRNEIAKLESFPSRGAKTSEEWIQEKILRECHALKLENSNIQKDIDALSEQVAASKVRLGHTRKIVLPAVQSEIYAAKSKLVKLQHSNAATEKKMSDTRIRDLRVAEMLDRQKSAVDSLSKSISAQHAQTLNSHVEVNVLAKRIEIESQEIQNVQLALEKSVAQRENLDKVIDSINDANRDQKLVQSIVGCETAKTEYAIELFHGKINRAENNLSDKKSAVRNKNVFLGSIRDAIAKLLIRIQTAQTMNAQLKSNLPSLEILKTDIAKLKHIESDLYAQEHVLDKRIHKLRNFHPQNIHPINLVKSADPEKYALIESIRSTKSQRSDICHLLVDLNIEKRKLHNRISSTNRRPIASRPISASSATKSISPIPAVCLIGVRDRIEDLKKQALEYNQIIADLMQRKASVKKQHYQAVSAQSQSTKAIKNTDFQHEYKYVGGGFRVN